MLAALVVISMELRITLGGPEQVVKTNPFSRQVIDNANCKIQNTTLVHHNFRCSRVVKRGTPMILCHPYPAGLKMK